jgi:hypothetical protein
MYRNKTLVRCRLAMNRQGRVFPSVVCSHGLPSRVTITVETVVVSKRPDHSNVVQAQLISTLQVSVEGTFGKEVYGHSLALSAVALQR